MSLNIPEPLLQLEANCGVFAIWLILKQYQTHIDIA
ncbi:MAG: peptidase C39, partial [Pseudomonadota bacterium]|nr:peptidase C39 [Pseudomonadota bacterium]